MDDYVLEGSVAYVLLAAVERSLVRPPWGEWGMEDMTALE